jgi:CheY-like chemotaxis protein
MGIPREKQQLVFDSFAQVDGSTTRRFGGTGLGFTISRQLVELMGGRIWLESELGKGSTFHFTCKLLMGSTALTPREKIAEKALPGLNVLVVDNHRINREILAEMLSNWRMNPTVADSGGSALQILDAARAAGRTFPIVVLDAMMPKIDGFQVLQELQTKPGVGGAVIMLISANRQLVDAARCRDLGVERCLTKPVGQSELLDAILLSLGHIAAEELLVETRIHVSEGPKGRSLNILLSEDNSVNQKLAIRLLEKAGHRVTLACNGREAVAIWEKSGSPGFDVLLMDIQMPEMDGTEATAAIREREIPTGRHVPIIAMTANAMRGDKEKYIAGGMDGYVSKPIQPSDLFAELDRCVGSPERSTAMAESKQESSEKIDRASLLERVEGDQELLAEMAQLFQEELPMLIGAMRTALESGDMVVLERSAHSLKGAAGNLSASVTALAALQLEKDAGNKDAEAAGKSFLKVEQAVQQLLPALADLCQGVPK